MTKQKEKTQDLGQEKHVPVVTKTENGFLVKVGEVEHPMTTEHYIEWVEVLAQGRSFKVFFKPGDKPEAEFNLNDYNVVRSYCNIHGLWKS